MARLDRLPSRESAQAKLYTRLRQLFVLVLTIIFGVLISVSVNAQKTSEKKKSSEKKKTKIYKMKNWSKAYHYANACEILEKKRTTPPATNQRLSQLKKVKQRSAQPAVVASASPAVSMDQSIIREMVALDLRERKGNNPIELSPLSVIVSKDQVMVEDINPLLIAVEFALQGRTILIQGQSVNTDQEKPDDNTISITEIKKAMNRMGVPDERISISGDQLISRSPGNQFVHLTAL